MAPSPRGRGARAAQPRLVDVVRGSRILLLVGEQPPTSKRIHDPRTSSIKRGCAALTLLPPGLGTRRRRFTTFYSLERLSDVLRKKNAKTNCWKGPGSAKNGGNSRPLPCCNRFLDLSAVRKAIETRRYHATQSFITGWRRGWVLRGWKGCPSVIKWT